MGIKVHYLHSEIDILERVGILRDLRLGVFDVVVAINLLREGLDLPEVSLVAILDADKTGFLRPVSIYKDIRDLTDRVKGRAMAEEQAPYNVEGTSMLPQDELRAILADMEEQMKTAAENLKFEKAAALRDQIFEIREILAEEGDYKTLGANPSPGGGSLAKSTSEVSTASDVFCIVGDLNDPQETAFLLIALEGDQCSLNLYFLFTTSSYLLGIIFHVEQAPAWISMWVRAKDAKIVN